MKGDPRHSIGAHRSWAATPDRAARTAAARRGKHEKRLREARENLGPDASEADVYAAAENARQAKQKELSRLGVAARKALREAS